MEELKQAMTGIVERSRARRTGSRLQKTPALDPSKIPVLQPPQPVLQISPPVLQSPLLVTPSILQSSIPTSSPHMSLMSTPEQQKLLQGSLPVTSCVSLPSKPFVDAQFRSHMVCALVGSVTSTPVNSMSVDSLERPTVAHDPSCMSSRDTISECDAEYGSQTDIECQSDCRLNEPQSDRLAHLEVASSMSTGDLSMGSDSVFISETETLSGGTSRCPSTHTINPVYIAEDQQNLSISKSSLLSPNTKHVHFKFDADTASTMSEDEHQIVSPNFAQAVLSNYLSSHRNSISQVIEALSSLAQADITAEIEMTIEQNKKEKGCRHPHETSVDRVTSPKLDSTSIPVIEITEPPVDISEQAFLSQEPQLYQEKLNEKYSQELEKTEDQKILIEKQTEMSVEYDLTTKDKAVSKDKGSDRDELEKLEQMNESDITKREAEVFRHVKVEEKKQGISQALPVKDALVDKTKEQKTVTNPVPKIQRKSILKNTGNKSKNVMSQAQESSSDHSREGTKTTRQLTPTPRRKPILKKKETMVSSSSIKHFGEKESFSGKKSSPQTAEGGMREQISKMSRSNSKICKSTCKSAEHSQVYAKSKFSGNNARDKHKVSVEAKSEGSKLSQKVGASKISQSLTAQTLRRSISLPTTPVPIRKERPSPPSELPLDISYESSSESLKESKCSSIAWPYESSPTSSHKAMHKSSPNSEERLSKIPKSLSREHSFDSLTGFTGSPKRNVWSEPSSPMSTPQLIRKTFKQIHENTKIPMAVYQYSSTEDLEDSSPQESPRVSREKRHRSLIRPPRAMSVDRAIDLTSRKTKEENPKTSKVSPRTQSPLPVSPRIQSPTSVRVTGKVSGKVQSPTHGRVKSPISGKKHSPSQSFSSVTSPGSTPKKFPSPRSTLKSVMSPGSTKQIQSVLSTPKALQSPSSAPKMSQSPTSTPKRVLSPDPQSSFNTSRDSVSKTGTRPKVPRVELFPLNESAVRNPKQKSASLPRYLSASDSEEHSSPVGSSRVKSSKYSRSGGMRRADSLEEFLLLENECMD